MLTSFRWMVALTRADNEQKGGVWIEGQGPEVAAWPPVAGMEAGARPKAA
jgi:hypothetical protein